MGSMMNDDFRKTKIQNMISLLSCSESESEGEEQSPASTTATTTTTATPTLAPPPKKPKFAKQEEGEISLPSSELLKRVKPNPKYQADKLRNGTAATQAEKSSHVCLLCPGEVYVAVTVKNGKSTRNQFQQIARHMKKCHAQQFAQITKDWEASQAKDRENQQSARAALVDQLAAVTPSGARQLTIEDVLDLDLAPRSLGNLRLDTIQRRQAIAAVTFAVLKDGLPTSLLEGDSGLCQTLRFLTGDGGLRGTCHSTINRYIVSMYLATRKLFKERVADYTSRQILPSISTLTDEWTTSTNQPMLGLGVRLLDLSTLVPECHFVGLELITGGTTAASLADLMKARLSSLVGISEDDIEAMIVGGSTDNAAAAVKFLQDVVGCAIPCLGHTLSLAAKDAMGVHDEAGLDGDAILGKLEAQHSTGSAPLTEESSPMASFLKKCAAITTLAGRSPKFSSEYGAFQAQKGVKTVVSLKREAPTRWLGTIETVFSVRHALAQGELMEFMERFKPDRLSTAAYTRMKFTGADRLMSKQLSDVMTPLRDAILTSQREGLSCAEGYVACLDLYAQLTGSSVRETDVNGEYVPLDSRAHGASKTYKSAELMPVVGLYRAALAESLLRRTLQEPGDEVFVSLFFDPKQRTSVALLSQTLDKTVFAYLADHNGHSWWWGTSRELIRQRARRVVTRMGLEQPGIGSPPASASVPELPADLGGVSLEARLAVLHNAQLNAAKIAPKLVEPPPSHIDVELKKFDDAVRVPEWMMCSGSEFFSRRRADFPILYHVFCSNRVLCPSNARLESWFSEAERVKPTTRASLSADKHGKIMFLRASPFFTLSSAIKVASEMPGPGVVGGRGEEKN